MTGTEAGGKTGQVHSDGAVPNTRVGVGSALESERSATEDFGQSLHEECHVFVHGATFSVWLGDTQRLLNGESPNASSLEKH